MKKSSWIVSSALSISLSSLNFAQAAPAPVGPDGSWVGGFYSSWSYWRGGSGIKSLDDLQKQVGSLNFVTYAFLTITTNNSLKNLKPVYGGIVINPAQQGPAGNVIDLEFAADNSTGECPGKDSDPAWCAASHIYKYLTDYVKKSDSKTVLLASVGGWSYTGRFSDFYQDYKAAGGGDDLEKNPITKQFLDSSIKWLSDHNQFSGLDIDWEYPGFGHGGYDEATKKAHEGEGVLYTKLMTTLRTKLNELSTTKNRPYYLTTAVVGVKEKAQGEASRGVNWSQVNKAVDWINVMAFDIHGEFDAADGGSGKAFGMSSPEDLQPAIEYYLSQGIPSKKIILGVPTYAREMLVADQPSSDNHFGYAGNLYYEGYKQFFKAFEDEYYKNNPSYFDYNDNPNPESYYPAGGMVDFTGAYDYQCFLSTITAGKAQNDCPLLAKKDNRGNQGVALPTDLTLSSQGDGIAWISGGQQNVAANFTNAPQANYPAYPVFTIETQDTVKWKMQHLVKHFQLGGAWFWELASDSTKQPQYSLYKSAHDCLVDKACK